MDKEGFFGNVGISRNALQQATGIARIVACASVVLLTASCGTDEPSRKPTGASGAALNSSPTIANFVLYAERSVTLGSHDSVAGGDVGVRATVASSFGPQLTIGEHATVDAARNLLASCSTQSRADAGNRVSRKPHPKTLPRSMLSCCRCRPNHSHPVASVCSTRSPRRRLATVARIRRRLGGVTSWGRALLTRD